MLIRVTKNDIQRGIPGDPCSCPVARAIKRTFHWRYVGVDHESISRRGTMWGAEWIHQFDTPGIARRFIRKFDVKDKVKPFKFTLPVKSKKED